MKISSNGHFTKIILYFQTTPTDLQLLSQLCDNFLPAFIASCKLPVYTATTECDRRYGYTTARRRSYAESLCLRVNSDLTALINSCNTSESRHDSQLGDALAREEAEQQQLCDILSRFYDVLRPEQEKVRVEQMHEKLINMNQWVDAAAPLFHDG